MIRDPDNLNNERGRQLTSHMLKDRLGHPKNWPDEGVLGQWIGNTLVYVKPRNPVGGKSHRAFAVCAYCAKHVPAGRLHQHLSVHKDLGVTTWKPL
jgi:hypothetical protein